LESNVKALETTVVQLKEDKVKLQQQLEERDAARVMLERKLLGEVRPPGSPRTSGASPTVAPSAANSRSSSGVGGGGLSLFDE
jgi:hypothetical protein